MISVDGSSLNPAMIIVIVIATVLANAITGALSEIGWKSALLKDLEICRSMKEAATGKVQEEIAKKFSDDVYSRILQKTFERRGYDELRRTVLHLIPEYLMSTAVTIFTLVILSAVITPVKENLAAFTTSAIVTGVAMLLIESTARSSKSRKREHGKPECRND